MKLEHLNLDQLKACPVNVRRKGAKDVNDLTALVAEGVTEPVPCIIMDKGDDARANEASLAENFIRLPMDEIDQYKAFSALAAKDKSAEEIASVYGLTVCMVQRRMAIANLPPRILKAYSEGKIDGESVRALTLASKTKQQEW